jgi:hypothetical protein
MNLIEQMMFEVSGFFMLPVLLVLCAMFCHALYALGSFLYDLTAKVFFGRRYAPLLRIAASTPGITQEDLELRLLRELEGLRITSRIAPLLGLVATMIPMGPALMAVAKGDSMGMAEQLVIAFAAVIVALLAAAMTYVVLLVRRRWLLGEINDWLAGRMEETCEPDDETATVRVGARA